jgi:mRNA interferase MazF
VASPHNVPDVVDPGYVPEKGDIIRITLDPVSGHEQGGRRPAVVLSDVDYNTKTGLAIACPITNRAKNYPFEVPLPANVNVTGVILSDQIRCLDWRGRRAVYLDSLPVAEYTEILRNVVTVIGK